MDRYCALFNYQHSCFDYNEMWLNNHINSVYILSIYNGLFLITEILSKITLYCNRLDIVYSKTALIFMNRTSQDTILFKKRIEKSYSPEQGLEPWTVRLKA